MSDQQKQAERPRTYQSTSDAPGTTAAAPGQSVPQVQRFVAGQPLRDLYICSNDTPPEIPSGALVELAMFRDNPPGYYRFLRADPHWLGSSLAHFEDAFELSLLDLPLIMTDFEQAEADGLRADETVFWTRLVDRLAAVALETDSVASMPDGRARNLKIISCCTRQAVVELLKELTVSSSEFFSPYENLDFFRVLMSMALEQADELEPEADEAELQNRDECVVYELPESSELEWQPLGSKETYPHTQENMYRVLTAIDFAVAHMGLSLATVELGRHEDSVIHAIRAIKG